MGEWGEKAVLAGGEGRGEGTALKHGSMTVGKWQCVGLKMRRYSQMGWGGGGLLSFKNCRRLYLLPYCMKVQ
jgi:hypothetical protein